MLPTASDPARVHSPLKWYGGKYYLAPRIVALMPPHTHYVEPFAGGLSVLFAKNPEGISEVVNDLNSDLINFYRVLRGDRFAQFERAVSLTPFAREEWGDARALLAGADGADVERAAAFFVACRQSYSGKMDSFAPTSRGRVRVMSDQVSAWLGAIAGLPAIHARLSRVYVDHAPAVDVIRKRDGGTTVFYLDPPYMHETRTGGPVYAHEMTTGDHTDLLMSLRDIKGKFLLSGYRSELYDRYAAAEGWSRVDISVANNAALIRDGGGRRRMMECVWMNYRHAEAT